jgi:polysaccharide biosynthesis transport protein
MASMDFRNYLDILWRRKWIIIVTVVVTMAVVVTGTLLMTPIYAATTTLRVTTVPTGSTSYVPVDYADRLMNTYVQLASSRPVLDELQQRLGLAILPAIKAEIVANTELIRITVEDPDPTLAAKAANILSSILINQVAAPGTQSVRTAALDEQLAQIDGELYQARQDYDNLVRNSPGDAERLLAAQKTIDLKQGIYATLLQQREQARLADTLQANSASIVEPAVVPAKPARPSKALNIGLGLLVALSGGVGLTFLFENLDTRLYTVEQFKKVPDMPVLGVIPTAKKDEIGNLSGGSPAKDEAFRRLRVNLFARDRETALHTLVVASAEQGEGKSSVVANLALTIAQSKRKVVVVDGDLRRPTLHLFFGLPNDVGLSSVLKQEATLDQALQNSAFPRIQVLASGPIPYRPTDLLDSAQMTAVIRELAKRCDVVLFDAPALMPVTDAAVLAPMVDGVLLVVGRAQSRQETVQAACQQLADVKARVIGLVVNRVEPSRKYDHYVVRR